LVLFHQGAKNADEMGDFWRWSYPQITQIILKREPQIALMDADFCPQFRPQITQITWISLMNCLQIAEVIVFWTHSPNHSDSPSKSLGLYEFISVHLRNLRFLKE